MIDNQRVFRFEVKTRFRFSSEGGVGKKTRFGGGRFVIGTPSLPSNKPISHLSHQTNLFLISPIKQTYFIFSHQTNLFHFLIYLPSHKPISHLSPITQTYFSSISHHTNLFHFLPSHKPISFSHLSPIKQTYFCLSPITQTYFIFSSISHQTHLSTQHKKNRIDINQSYLKHDLINLLN